jgi:hypothetical protein
MVVMSLVSWGNSVERWPKENWRDAEHTGANSFSIDFLAARVAEGVGSREREDQCSPTDEVLPIIVEGYPAFWPRLR